MARTVSVHNVNGDKIEFKVEPQATTNSLKNAISDLWQVPSECQVLIAGATLLGGSDDLISQHCPNEKLELTMLISVEKQIESLKSADVQNKQAALHVLGCLGRRGDGGAEVALATLLQHIRDAKTAQDRVNALETLAMIVEPDSKHVAMGMSYLRAGSANVRAAAVALLGSATAKDDRQTIVALCQGLTDTGIVRVATVHALARLRGNEHALSAVMQHLEHEDYDVRCSAVQALMQLSQRGDACTIAKLQEVLRDRDPNVRNAAEHALFHLSPSC